MTARKIQIVDAFSAAAAATYDRAASMQRKFAGKLAEVVARRPLAVNPRVLEIGCGTGALSEALLNRVDGGNFLITDLSPSMVESAKARIFDPRAQFGVLDGENPGEVRGPFDLVVSNMTVQWFSNLAAGLETLAGLLAPGGRMVFTTLGAKTFREWRRGHDALGLDHGVPDFPEARTLYKLLPGRGDGDVAELEIKAPFADAFAFVRNLKEIGASVPVGGHRPLGPGDFRNLAKKLGKDFGVTYHVLTVDFIKNPEQ